MPVPDGVSSLHSNVAEGCVDVKVKLGFVWFVAPLGPPMIVVSGGAGVAVGEGLGDGVGLAVGDGDGDGVGLAVGEGVGDGVGEAVPATRMMPVMKGCAEQRNVYSPGVLNVQ